MGRSAEERGTPARKDVARRGAVGRGVALLLAAVVLAATACENVFFHEPADEGLPVRVSYDLASSVAGQTAAAQGFEEADEVRLRIVSDGGALVDRVVPLAPAEGGFGKVARVEVPVGDEPRTVSVEATFLVNGDPVLQGFRSFLLDPNADTTPRAEVELLPVLGEDQTRVVLSWGENPRDLDSHMTGPDGQGGSFHVYYVNRGSATGPPFVSLDTDDTQGFGPETITIWEQQPGTYCYSVHRFGGTGALSASGATVEVYRGDTRVRTFEVPDGTGDVWTVFRLTTDGITAIDRIEDVPPPGVCE